MQLAILLCVLAYMPADEWKFEVVRTEQPTFQVQTANDERLLAIDPKSVDIVVFTADWCVYCKKWFKSEEYQKLKAAGYTVWSADVKEPQWKRMVGKGLPCFHLVDIETRQPIREWVGSTTFEQLTGPVEVDPVCRLSNATFRWSGFAISDSRILTVAHHDTSGRFRAEFPVKGKADQFVTLFAAMGPTDKTLDVNVLRFGIPTNVTMKPLPLGDGVPKSIDGFAEGTTRKSIPVTPVIQPPGTKIDYGPNMFTLKGVGITSPQFGMSGSPVISESGTAVGIQRDGDKHQIWAASLNAIQKVLAVDDTSQ